MTLRSGTRLGPYEIVGPLGAGGMGEVYRARDSRLGRDVAVKALPAASRLDRDRVARFQREAQILAALNHPHIAAIYGLEEASGGPGDPAPSQFLILELVEGGTLADRIARGPMPVREVLTAARQVADALQAAHDKGIIHRDLKPGNIALTPDGQAKVLDFGLAKPPASRPDDPTVAAPATQTGVVQGTAAYMSPEQARGLPLDKRTDIWSFGCVWFEALAGRHPFSARSASDMIAAILGRDPDWSQLPAEVPPRVAWLLRRCLDKDPRQRLHDIADARIELDEAIARPDSAGGIEPVSPSGRLRERVAWAAAALGLAAGAASVLLTGLPGREPQPGEAPPFHASVVFPPDLRLSVSEDPAARVALSPDGRRLAVVAIEPSGESKLWVRPLDGPAAQPLAGTEGASHPFWSPDSRSIGFLALPTAEGAAAGGAKLKRIDLANGQVSTVGDTRFAAGGSWNRDDVILFTPSGTSPIHRISASGGPASPVTSLDPTSGDVQHTNPFFLPDGRHFLYSALGSRTGGATHSRAVYLGSLDAAGPPTLLLEGGTNAKVANDQLLFVRSGTLMAQPFDMERRRLVPGTAPVPLAEGVQEVAGGGSAAFSASTTGVIAYLPVVPVPMQLEWFDRTGLQTGTLGEHADYADLVLSPDGSQAAVSRLDPSAGTRDIWVFDVKRGLRERITSHPGDDIAPVWSPTGDRLVFSSSREGRVDLYLTTLGEAGSETQLPGADLGVGRFGSSWTADGRLIFVAGARVIARSDLWIQLMSGDGKPVPFAEGPYIETQPRFSRDGRWVVYSSAETGRLELYVRPSAGPGNRVRVSSNGGRYGLWRENGSEIFFLSPDNQVMAATVRSQGSQIQVLAIRPLFRIRFRRIRLDAYPYAVTPDGQRFLVNTLVEEAGPPAITLLINWRATMNR